MRPCSCDMPNASPYRPAPEVRDDLFNNSHGWEAATGLKVVEILGAYLKLLCEGLLLHLVTGPDCYQHLGEVDCHIGILCVEHS